MALISCTSLAAGNTSAAHICHHKTTQKSCSFESTVNSKGGGMTAERKYELLFWGGDILQPHEGRRCLLSIFHHLRLFFICFGVFARPVGVFGLRAFARKKCLKAEIVRLSSPARSCLHKVLPVTVVFLFFCIHSNFGGMCAFPSSLYFIFRCFYVQHGSVSSSRHPFDSSLEQIPNEAVSAKVLSDTSIQLQPLQVFFCVCARGCVCGVMCKRKQPCRKRKNLRLPVHAKSRKLTEWRSCCPRPTA